MKNGLFSENTLQKIQKARKIFLKLAIWMLIAELFSGAFLILTGIWGIEVGKIQGSLLILTLILFISVNNFIRLEKGNKTIQIFALLSFISDLIWGVFAFLLMWEIVPFNWTTNTNRYLSGFYSTTDSHMTIYAIIMLTAAYAAAAGFWISNVLSIKETTKLVTPLKITATICIVYLWIFETITTPLEPDYRDVERLYQLAGLAGFAFAVTSLAALIVSKTNKKKSSESNTVNGAEAPLAPKTEAELKAEIEEKVRREMIEKEVRAKMEAEKLTPENPNLSDSETHEADKPSTDNLNTDNPIIAENKNDSAKPTTESSNANTPETAGEGFKLTTEDFNASNPEITQSEKGSESA